MPARITTDDGAIVIFYCPVLYPLSVSGETSRFNPTLKETWYENYQGAATPGR